MAPLVASALLNPINSTLIAVALIPIGHSLGASPAETAWLISALYLATAIGQPLMGLLVDRFGPRRVLLVGAGIVVLAGAGGLLALSLEWLVGVRALLGIGTCAAFPAAMTILRYRAEDAATEVPRRSLATLAIAAQTTMAIGPAFGGVLIMLFGWPSIFAVNVPLGVVAIVLALRWLPKDDRTANRTPLTKVDLGGILLFSLAMFAVLLFVMDPAPRSAYLLLIGIVVGGAFILVELRVRTPFVDLRTLRANRPILRTYLRQALAFLIIYAIMFGYVQWLEQGRGLSESVAGILLLPMSGMAIGTAALAARGRGVRAKLLVSGIVLGAGAGMLLFTHTASPLLLLLGIALVFGIAQGLTSVTNQTVLQAQAPTEQLGTLSGLFRSAQYVGAIGASTLIAFAYGAEASSAGLHQLAWLLIGASALLVLVIALDRSLSRKTLTGHTKRAAAAA
ncbi:putative MFS family arabinose efflux permease [Tamaricihabitans halophyticus]|uniref:Putative MFS family arabinose efflux permease n=1 Tax=Tamaricihabitans halophyticus TaxID=1262583 RepID=A0A4R2QND6_9PSEU|nr:MFS transporter [Tamaricihabitans halophyticus]TCP48575.1 putative MFS family arabinose efflux permease [Tamaricihabitans halophyticus]